ncbi:MAG TPA: hypothetical protein VIT62_14550 [Lysobacter sp.]
MNDYEDPSERHTNWHARLKAELDRSFNEVLASIPKPVTPEPESSK